MGGPVKIVFRVLSERAILRTSVAAALAISSTNPALANDVSDPGSFIVSRDIPTRYAYLPGEPTDANSVQTAPVGLIQNTVEGANAPVETVSFLASGSRLVPLGDDQIATVASGRPVIAVPTDAIDPLTITRKVFRNTEFSQALDLPSNMIGDNLSSSLGLGSPPIGALSSVLVLKAGGL